MNNRNNGRDEIECNIISHIGVIASYQTGWAKELNIVSWNGGVAKYDIRDWSSDHSRMNKGITLHKDEAKALLELLIPRFTRDDAPKMQENRYANQPPQHKQQEQTQQVDQTEAVSEDDFKECNVANVDLETGEIIEEQGEQQGDGNMAVGDEVPF